jgi:hypothetical protein
MTLTRIMVGTVQELNMRLLFVALQGRAYGMPHADCFVWYDSGSKLSQH